MDLTKGKWEVMELIDPDQTTKKWLAFVNTLMNFGCCEVVIS
jgi:hypothetical protein